MDYSLQKILPSNNCFEQAIAIYEQSLPANERQPRLVIEDRLNQNLCTLYVAMENTTVIGTMIIWDFDGTPFSFLDYLAVHPDYRGKGIGEFCMRIIQGELSESNKMMLIEVEDPDYGEDRVNKVRRIRFYEKCGARWLANTPYILPPLDGTTTTPMLILIVARENVNRLEGAMIQSILRRVYRAVYGRAEDDQLLNSFINKIGDEIFLQNYQS